MEFTKSEKSYTVCYRSLNSAITEVCYKILFVCAISLFIEIVSKYPITVPSDNVGSLLISDITLLYQLTKHIGIRHHFIRDCVEDGTVKMKKIVHKKTS